MASKTKQPITWALRQGVKISDIELAAYNPRKLSDKAKADLRKSVEKFGTAEPVVLNLADGGKKYRMVGGHSRVAIYAESGRDTVDAMVPSRALDPKEEKELNIRLNRNVGEWDFSKLKEFFEVDELLLAGFDEEELRVNFGLDTASEMDLDPERFLILTVRPPESPILAERAMVKFETMNDYLLVKQAIATGKVTAADILGLAK